MTEPDRQKLKSRTGPDQDSTKKFQISDRAGTKKRLKFSDLFGSVSPYTGRSVDPCLWWYVGCWPWCDWRHPWYISWLCFWLWYFQGSLHRTISFRKLFSSDSKRDTSTRGNLKCSKNLWRSIFSFDGIFVFYTCGPIWLSYRPRIQFLFKTGLNVVTSLMALCATSLGITACVLNRNYGIDNYIYISIYGMEGLFLLSKCKMQYEISM